MTIGSTPFIGNSSPLSESSPINIDLLRISDFITPSASSIDMAIGKS